MGRIGKCDTFRNSWTQTDESCRSWHFGAVHHDRVELIASFPGPKKAENDGGRHVSRCNRSGHNQHPFHAVQPQGAGDCVSSGRIHANNAGTRVISLFLTFTASHSNEQFDPHRRFPQKCCSAVMM